MRILCRRGGLSHLLQLLCYTIVLYESLAFRCHSVDRSIRRRTRPAANLVTTDSDNDAAGAATTKPRVRFTGTAIPDNDTTLSNNNPVDTLLSLITSDISSIALGLVGVLIILVNRLSLDDSTPMSDLERETRSSLLALVACGSVLVNGVSKLNVESVLAEQVELDGTNYNQVLMGELTDTGMDRPSLEWVMSALMTATPSSSVVYLQYLQYGWKIGAATGVLPLTQEDKLTALPVPASTPILDRLRNDGSQQESYLPTLQNLPGRTEFTYIPSNTQAVVLVPVGSTGVLVLGSNQAKSFTPRDIAWSLSVATRINATIK